MKKLILVAAILVSTLSFAQQGQQRGNRGPRPEKMMADFTPEQMADLQTKRMTLALDLTEKQQKEVLKINTDRATKMKAKFEEMKAKKASGEGRPQLTADEKYAMESARLDEQIALQNKMKSILTEDQYKKWSVMREHKKEEMKDRFNDRKGPEGHNKRR